MSFSVVHDETVAAPTGLGPPHTIPREGPLALDERVWESEVVVVAGDDFTIARVATHLYELRRDHAHVPAILPLSRGDVGTVAAAVGAEKLRVNRGLIRALRRGRMKIERVPSLRIIDAASPHARLGFNLGMGALFDVFEHRARSGRGGRRATVEAIARTFVADRGDVVEAPVWIDWQERGEHFRQLLASSLYRSWFGVRMMKGGGPGVRLGRTALELVEARSRLSRVTELATQHRAEPFERIHIDTTSGYVLDGELVDPGCARTLVVERGPNVGFTTG